MKDNAKSNKPAKVQRNFSFVSEKAHKTCSFCRKVNKLVFVLTNLYFRYFPSSIIEGIAFVRSFRYIQKNQKGVNAKHKELQKCKF